MRENSNIFILDDRNFESAQVKDILLAAGYVEGENIFNINDMDDAMKIRSMIVPAHDNDVGSADIDFNHQKYVFTSEYANLEELLNNLYSTSYSLNNSDLPLIIDGSSDFESLLDKVDKYNNGYDMYNNEYPEVDENNSWGDRNYNWATVNLQETDKGYIFEYETYREVNNIQIEYDGEKYALRYEVLSNHAIVDSTIINSAEKNELNFEPTNEQLIKNDIYNELLVKDIIKGDEETLEGLANKLPTYYVEWSDLQELPSVSKQYISTNNIALKNIASLDSDVAEQIKEMAQEKLDAYNNEKPFFPGEYIFNYEVREGTFYQDRFEAVKSSLADIVTHCENVIASDTHLEPIARENTSGEIYALVSDGVCSHSDGIDVSNLSTISYEEDGKYKVLTPMEQIAEMTGQELSFEQKCISAYIEDSKYDYEYEDEFRQLRNFLEDSGLNWEEIRQTIDDIKNTVDEFNKLDHSLDEGMEM